MRWCGAGSAQARRGSGRAGLREGGQLPQSAVMLAGARFAVCLNTGPELGRRTGCSPDSARPSARRRGRPATRGTRSDFARPRARPRTGCPPAGEIRGPRVDPHGDAAVQVRVLPSGREEVVSGEVLGVVERPLRGLAGIEDRGGVSAHRAPPAGPQPGDVERTEPAHRDPGDRDAVWVRVRHAEAVWDGLPDDVRSPPPR
jgi:hypothetical protein